MLMMLTTMEKLKIMVNNKENDEMNIIFEIVAVVMVMVLKMYCC
jgi:hypothetical protein